MACGDLEFSFAKVDYGLGHFPIIFKYSISCVEVGIYSIKLE
jgi:hypothetical protein